MNIKTFYSFKAWTKGDLSDFFDSDTIELYAESFNSLIEKIKLFNKVSCFECWTSLQFYKWAVTYLENGVDKSIIRSCHFPEMIGAHKIKVWDKTYEI